jgi:hypothetical protein
MKSLLSTLFLSVFAGIASLPAQEAKPLSESHSELACQFETTAHFKDESKPDVKYTWRMWRAKHEVEVYQLGSRDGEAWRLDGAGGVMLARILHPERVEVVFNAMELRIQKRPADWYRCCSLVSEELLGNLLKPVGSQSFLGREVQEFKGEIGSEKWSVLWDKEDQLAVSIEVESDKLICKTSVQERHPLSQQPWERLTSRGYESLGYTELADNDTDPRIKRIMARMGIKCSHKGCGPVCLTPQP